MARLLAPLLRRPGAMAAAKRAKVKDNRRSSIFVKRGSVCMGLMNEIELEEVYEIIRHLGTGRFGNVRLAEHKDSGTRVALKLFPKASIKHVDFVREYNYSFFLSPHQHIVVTYEGVNSTSDAFFFVQEYCPTGSLRDLVQRTPGGLSEEHTKTVMEQVTSALEFMHSERLVHRNLKAENVLLFDPKSYRVKVADFGLTRKEDASVKHIDSPNCYMAPEVCSTLVKETVSVDKSWDIWSLGILIYYSMRGKYPWHKACITQKSYYEWEMWIKRKNPQLPAKWSRYTEKGVKMFKKSLNPKPKDRMGIKDMRKYMKERWLKEIKSVSEEDLFVEPNSLAFSNKQLSKSLANMAVESPTEEDPPKRRSMIHQFFANTLSAMAEISEQVVSATEQ